MRSLRRLVERVLTAPPCALALRPLQNGVGSIFMLHRFSDPTLGVRGHEPQLVAECIHVLRRRGFRVRRAIDLVEAALRGDDVSRSVAFTVDDGYVDFETVGGPLFRELDAPVTVFVPTGIVDRRSWFWWDRVTEGLRLTTRDRVTVELNGVSLTVDPRGGADSAASDALVAALKRFPRPEADDAIDRLLDDLGVELPERPPRRFAVMSWEAIREQVAAGAVDFGPHTVSHAILGRLPRDRAEAEIRESWGKLKEEAGDGAVPLFCYPNGERHDYDPAHFGILADAGLSAAVTAEPWYVHPRAREDLQPYAVPRFAMPEDLLEFKSLLLGVERLKAATRSALGGLAPRKQSIAMRLT